MFEKAPQRQTVRRQAQTAIHCQRQHRRMKEMPSSQRATSIYECKVFRKLS